MEAAGFACTKEADATVKLLRITWAGSADCSVKLIIKLITNIPIKLCNKKMEPDTQHCHTKH